MVTCWNIANAPAILHSYLQGLPRNEKPDAWGKEALLPVHEGHTVQSHLIPFDKF